MNGKPLPRFAPDMPSIPRRVRIDLWHPAEKAINDAMRAVETCGAGPRLTDAVRRLDEAHEALADHLEAVPPEPPASDEAAADAFLAEVRAELVRARAKFPGDRIMTIALAEEFGELCKAVLDEPAANVRKEAVQTAVMAARVALDGDGSVASWRAERGLDPIGQAIDADTADAMRERS